MLAFLFTFREFWRAIRYALRDPQFQSLTAIVGAMLLLGAVFYHNIEGWRWLDSLYFSVVTLTTVGYGDLAPKTAFGKVFTMVYIVLGIGLIVALATRVADALMTVRRESTNQRQARRLQQPADERDAQND